MENTIMFLQKQLKGFGIDLSEQYIVIGLGISILVIFFLIALLIFRGARLKYWKIDRQVGALESIEKQLREIVPKTSNSLKPTEEENLGVRQQILKESISETILEVIQAELEEAKAKDEYGRASKTRSAEPKASAADISLESEKIIKKEEFKKGFLETYNVGNKGQIYIEEELAELIKY